MKNSDSEFDFDCPRFSYDLNAYDCGSEEQTNYIDPWFLTYHFDHDRRKSQQSELEMEKSNHGKLSKSNPVRSTILGPARSAKRMSTTSSSSSHSSYVSSKSSSQKGDDLRTDETKYSVREKSSRISIGLKRKSLAEESSDDKESIQGGSTTSTDLRDKLDEFRQRKKKDSTVESMLILSAPKVPIPPTDYSRSKLLTGGTEGGSRSSVNVSSTTAAKLALAKKLTSGLNKTSTGIQSTNATLHSNSPSSSRSMHLPITSSSSSSASTTSRLVRRSSTAPTATSGTTQSSTKTTSKPVAKLNVANDNDVSMMELLKKHNQRFAPIPIYEPPRHSVRDVRKWEKSSGKTWSSLRPEEREVANAEIGRIKEIALKESQK